MISSTNLASGREPLMSSRMRLRRCSMNASAAVCRRTLRSMAQALAPTTKTTASSSPTRIMRLRTVSKEGLTTTVMSSNERIRISKATSPGKGLASSVMQMPVTRTMAPIGISFIGGSTALLAEG